MASPSGANPSISLADAECQLVDGRAVKWNDYEPGPYLQSMSVVGDQTEYMVLLEDLQTRLDAAAAVALKASTGSDTSATVKQCRLGLVWEFSVAATAAPSLSHHSRLHSISQVRQVLSYANDRWSGQDAKAMQSAVTAWGARPQTRGR